jgi:hypothetical protein
MTYVPSVTMGTGPTVEVGQRTSSTLVADVCAVGMLVEYQAQETKANSFGLDAVIQGWTAWSSVWDNETGGVGTVTSHTHADAVIKATADVSQFPTTVSDSFTGSDGTLLSAHTPETGTAWTNAVGDGQIQSNSAAGSTGSISVQESGLSPFGLWWGATVNLGADGADRSCRLIYRYSDTSNYCYLEVWRASGGATTRLRIGKVVSGSDVPLATDTGLGFAASTDYAVEIEVSGDVHIARLASVERLRVTDTFNNSATKVGMGWI